MCVQLNEVAAHRAMQFPHGTSARVKRPLKLSPGPRMAMSLLATASSIQTERSPFASSSDSKPTDPSGRVAAIASKAAGVREMRIMENV